MYIYVYIMNINQWPRLVEKTTSRLITKVKQQ